MRDNTKQPTPGLTRCLSPPVLQLFPGPHAIFAADKDPPRAVGMDWQHLYCEPPWVHGKYALAPMPDLVGSPVMALRAQAVDPSFRRW